MAAAGSNKQEVLNSVHYVINCGVCVCVRERERERESKEIGEGVRRPTGIWRVFEQV